MTKIAVIIPFYQTEAGILRRALESALAQTMPEVASLNIIVVDDGSPFPARRDIEGLDVRSPFSLTLIEQPNGGCAAARDAGLRHIDESTDYIAFLDSDDWWTTDHIAAALTALGNGYDFYFTDHSRIDNHASHFADISFPRSDAPAGTFTSLGGDLWAVDKDYFYGFQLRKFTAQISTVVYRRSIKPDASFCFALRTVGEDTVFILQIVKRAFKVCFLQKADVICGKGVNIYYGKFSWGDEGHIRRQMGEVLSLYMEKSVLDLSPEDRRFIDSSISRCRKAFAFSTLRWLLKARRKWSPELVALTREDPRFFLWYPFYLIYTPALYALGRFRPI
jgi:succinoglycan biosynthesis protein ExoW